MASNGWSARLYWQWILYSTIAFVAVLTAVAVLSWIGADLLHLSFTNRSWLVALLVATAGALLFGGVLGTLYRRRTLGTGPEVFRVGRHLGSDWEAVRRWLAEQAAYEPSRLSRATSAELQTLSSGSLTCLGRTASGPRGGSLVLPPRPG